ncbi:cache domain-containing protein [Hippea alviniae]|uniref:cache domain-containing protein n=1 Tax=Hippea alviniae TaxID=1279027 RepID=UPI0003B7173D|nr:cache domain-containing protein [Hippea alviniae]
MKNKIKLKRLSSLFIFLSAIVIALVISVVWGFFFTRTVSNDISIFNKHVHIKREIQLERSQIRNIVDMINSERERAYKQLKETLKERDYRAWYIAYNIYKKYHGILSDDQIKERILDALRYQVFDRGKGYYFITSLNGVEILSPEKKLIGKNLLKNKKYAKFIQQEIEIVRKFKEGFVYGKFLLKGRVNKRIAYVKEFKPFNWYIGCGRFITTFEKDTKKFILKEISYAFSSFSNPSVFIIKINQTQQCPVKMIFYSPKISLPKNQRCLTTIKTKITYPDGTPCIADCLSKLTKTGTLTTELIWPFHENKLKKRRIVYLYYYKPFNWVIGSCAPKNFEAVFPNFKNILKENINKYTKNLFILSLILSILLAAVIWSLVFIQIIHKPVSQDISKIVKFFKEYKEGSRIELKNMEIEEIENIARNVNELFEQLENKNREIEKLLNRFESLAENMPSCLSIFERNENGEFVLTFANHVLLSCPAMKKQQIEGKRIDEIFKNIQNIKETIEIAFNYNRTVELTTKCPYMNKTVRLTMYKLDDRSVVCIFRDITDTVDTFKQREKIRKTFETFLDKIKTGIIVLDKKAHIRYVNIFAKKLLGVEDKSSLKLEELNLSDGIKYKFLKIIHGKETCESCEINITTVDGKSRWFEVYTAPLSMDKEPLVIISFNDITQKHIKNKQLEYLSFHDSLTGLYNRRYFEEELKRLFNKRNYPLTLMLFDLNGLKIANDILGHEIGDKLILKIAEILSTTSRGNDVVARIGGDEFAILMPNTDEEGATVLAARIFEKIRENNKKEKLRISASWGFAVQHGEFDDPDDLFKEADKSMYINKYSTNRKNELKEIIKWALSLKREKIKVLKETEIDEEYFLNR